MTLVLCGQHIAQKIASLYALFTVSKLQHMLWQADGSDTQSSSTVLLPSSPPTTAVVTVFLETVGYPLFRAFIVVLVASVSALLDFLSARTPDLHVSPPALKVIQTLYAAAGWRLGSPSWMSPRLASYRAVELHVAVKPIHEVVAHLIFTSVCGGR